LILYAAGFLLLALLLIYGAIFGARPDQYWLHVLAAGLAAAEGTGLLLSLWIARTVLKVLLALGIVYWAPGALESGAGPALVVPTGLAGLLLLEFGFTPVDRRIDAARRAGRN
jgi:hypothetical protein